MEIRLDRTTTRDWQRYSKECRGLPSHTKLLEFVDRQACDVADSPRSKGPLNREGKAIPSYVASAEGDGVCIACERQGHLLYACRKFSGLPYHRRMALVRENKLCLNCLKPGHFVKQCTSKQACKKCGQGHHTLLHQERQKENGAGGKETPGPSSAPSLSASPIDFVASTQTLRASGQDQVMLMTCQVVVTRPGGPACRARALLDTGSSLSFITERLAQRLRLPRKRHNEQIRGIGGARASVSTHGSVRVQLNGADGYCRSKAIDLEAVVLPQISSEIPAHPVPFKGAWKHLKGLPLADPEFGTPSQVDLLLGNDVFFQVLRHGRRHGPPGSPDAIETRFGWVLCGVVDRKHSHAGGSCRLSLASCDQESRRVWEVENYSLNQPVWSLHKQAIDHFQKKRRRNASGKFVVPLPFKADIPPLGESRSLAGTRFKKVHRSLRARSRFEQLITVGRGYFDLGRTRTFISTGPIGYVPSRVKPCGFRPAGCLGPKR